MAFGIDDALLTAAAGISLADTLIQTIKRYQKKKLNYDFELLLGEVRNTALTRINDADLALTQFERMLLERKIDLNKPIVQVIEETPIWRPFEQHRLSQIQKCFNRFSDSIYSASDDVVALARCLDQTSEIGISAIETSQSKHQLHERMSKAASIKEAIEILRGRLMEYKEAISG